MEVKINNSIVTTLKGSLSIEEAIEERSTCSFSIVNINTLIDYTKGDQVIIKDNNNDIVFSGVIENIKITDKGRYQEINCIDWHYLTDKRIIAKSYQNITCGQVIQDIVDTILIDEGITVGQIDDGALLTEAVFNYVSVSKAIETLSDKSVFIWYIDSDKKLYFISRKTFNSPFAIDKTKIVRNSVNVEINNPMYRNKQYVKGGKDITDLLTEKFKGDGENKTFTCGFPLAKVPTIKLNDVIQTVGIKSLSENKQWYWSKGDNTIIQDNSDIAITNSDTLEINYQGEFNIVVITWDKDEIETQKSREGTSGIVEDIADENENRTREDAFNSANSKLEKYSVIGKRLTFITWLSGLKIGQILTINFPKYNINNSEMLIETINATFDGSIFLYEITCCEAAERLSWTKMFEQLASKGKTFVVRENISENQILVTLDQFNKTWLETEKPNIFQEFYPSDTTYPSDNLYPMFEYEDRFKYIELLDNTDTVLLRKKVTKQTGEETNSITSITYIAPFEANGSIAKIRFYGGIEAAEEIGTGVILEEKVYIKDKTTLEAIQIDKIDTKGW